MNYLIFLIGLAMTVAGFVLGPFVSDVDPTNQAQFYGSAILCGLGISVALSP